MNSKILMNSSVQKVNGMQHVVLSNVRHSVPSSPRARPSSPSRIRWAAPKSPRRFVNCLQFGLYRWEGLQCWWFRTGVHRPEPSVREILKDWGHGRVADFVGGQLKDWGHGRVADFVSGHRFMFHENMACLFVNVLCTSEILFERR